MACDFPLLRRRFWGAAGWIEDAKRVPSASTPGLQTDEDSNGPSTLNNIQNPTVQTMLKIPDQSQSHGLRPGSSPVPGARPRTELISLNLSSINKEDVPKSELQIRREKFAYFEKRCSKVAEGVYLGSDAVARNRETLRSAQITHVLNCAGHICFNYFENELEYLTLWLEDTPAEDVTGILYLALDYVDAAIQGGGRVLIHCSQGVSRSSSLAIAYLMYCRGSAYDATYQAVKAIHGIANPNMGFACQLLQWQKRRLALSSGNPPAESRLYVIAPHSQIDARKLVTKPTAHTNYAALDPRGVFILHANNRELYVWIGLGAPAAAVEYADVATLQLAKYEHAAYPPATIRQGQEPAVFLGLLGLPDDTPAPRLPENDAYDSDFQLLGLSTSAAYVPPSPGMAVFQLRGGSKPATPALQKKPSGLAAGPLPPVPTAAPALKPPMVPAEKPSGISKMEAIPRGEGEICATPRGERPPGYPYNLQAASTGSGAVTHRPGNETSRDVAMSGMETSRGHHRAPSGSGDMDVDLEPSETPQALNREVLREVTPCICPQSVPTIGPDGRMSRLGDESDDENDAKAAKKSAGRVMLYEYPDLEQLSVFDIDDLDSEGLFLLLVNNRSGGGSDKADMVFVWVGRDHENAQKGNAACVKCAHEAGTKLGVVVEGADVSVEMEGEESNEFWKWFEDRG